MTSQFATPFRLRTRHKSITAEVSPCERVQPYTPACTRCDRAFAYIPSLSLESSRRLDSPIGINGWLLHLSQTYWVKVIGL